MNNEEVLLYRRGNEILLAPTWLEDWEMMQLEGRGWELVSKVTMAELKEELPEVIVAEKPSRPFPKTYGDWTSLAIDIKEKDPSSAFIVNDRLNVILYETGDVDAAKRWLVEKADELGIT